MSHITPELGLAYLEGQLDGARRAKLERHLADCPACQAELRNQQVVYDLLVRAGRQSRPGPPSMPNWFHIRPRPEQNTLLRPLLLGFIACAFVVVVVWLGGQPAPLEPLAAPPSPTSFPTSGPTSLPEPIVSLLTVTATRPGISPTPLPTVLPTPTVIAESPLAESLTAYNLGKGGQLAFIYGQALYVHGPAGNTSPLLVARPVSQFAWSPDGQQLLYQATEGDAGWFMWQALTKTTIAFNYLLPNFEPGNWQQPLWTADGKKIFLLDPAGGLIALADLGQQHFNPQWLTLTGVTGLWQVSNTTFLVQANDQLALYDLSGRRVADGPQWPGRVVFLEPGSHLLAVENNSITSLYDTNTWRQIWAGNATALQPRPDGGFVGLRLPDSSVTIVAHDGSDYGLARANSQMLAWRSDGGLVLAQTLAEEQTQLVYWPTSEGAVARAFVLPRNWLFPAGSWSPDGNMFIYNAIDPALPATYLYRWQPESGLPTLLDAHSGATVLTNFSWQADGQGFYFTVGDQEIWYYDVDMGVSRPVFIGPNP